eukprot:276679_1
MFTKGKKKTMDPVEIIEAIKEGPTTSIHQTKSIEKSIVNRCDAVSLATFIDPDTSLNIPSLCRLVLPTVSINMNQICHRGLFEMLKSCPIFTTLNIVDGIVFLIAEYIQNYDFVFEYEEQPRSKFNGNYYCDIKKVTLSPHRISVDIEEHGNMSLGRLQPPTDSVLALSKNIQYGGGHYYGQMGRAKERLALSYTSFYKYDIQKEVYGVLTYEWKNLYGQSNEDILGLKFSYGSSGYQFVNLFNSKK